MAFGRMRLYRSNTFTRVLTNLDTEQIDKLCATIERLVGEEDWGGVKDATVRLKYLQSIQTAARKWPTIENDEH